MTTKPDAPSCERNREPILQVLQAHFADRRQVLEIGSGTGQHAVHFAAAMPWLTWQCSDRAGNLPGIRAWLDDAGLCNTPAPVELDVAHGSWPSPSFDAVFTANTLHIMAWQEVEALFVGLGQTLASTPSEACTGPRSALPPSAPPPTRGEGLILAVYGPFNYGGDFSSDSNRAFDASLRARNPRMGIRDFEEVDALALGVGLERVDDIAMPANNRCLVWRSCTRGHIPV
ncbi:MAG: DUF938 domain-containing protein [Pseudoxanthomonas sp.]